MDELNGRQKPIAVIKEAKLNFKNDNCKPLFDVEDCVSIWLDAQSKQKSNVIQRYVHSKGKFASVVQAVYNVQRRSIAKRVIVNNIPFN